jgi:uncharacterized protein YjbI with pentapeptide repeats
MTRSAEYRRSVGCGTKVAGLIGFIVVVLVIWKAPPAFYKHIENDTARADAEASTRIAMIAGLAGLAALGGLAMTARTQYLTEQGQLTDRYTKAIEQLGSEKLDVRLGGIYALERIAVDSSRDHPTVVEVLSAFVREHSEPRHTDSQPVLADVLRPFLEGLTEPVHGNPPLSVDPGEKSGPAADLQAAVTVLGRLPKRPGVSRGDLSGAQLAGVWLTQADLSGAQLSRVNLSGATLRFVSLSDAELRQANLSEAKLDRVDLSGAYLNESNLCGIKLSETDFSRGRWYWLQKWFWGRVNVAEAMPKPRQEVEANLSDAQLNGADLSGAAQLTQRQLNVAQGDTTTKLPDGLQPPTRWAAGEDLP